jgi:hypothetical protein
MPTQLPEDARRRLEVGQRDLRDRCWYNVQRLHKWSGRLEREGPSGEDADYYESMGPRSLFLGPIGWDGPTDKRKLGWDEITAALRGKIRDLLGRYARELAALAGGEWWSLGLTGPEFEARMAAVLQSVLVDLKNIAKDADSDLGLGVEIEPLVAELNTGLQAWCQDYVERYGAHIGLYGTAETGLGAQPGAPQAGASSLKDRLRITSIDGSVRWINPEGSDPAESIWTSEDEKRISACVFDGRAAVRSELEGIFSGKEWPALAALVEPFRRYAVAVFDVYASAYSHVARTLAAYQEALNQLLLPMVLRDLFGREWDRSPGEKVVRMLWQDGPDGRPEGREVTVVAGNDPDPTCVFYDLLSNAIEHRYRFFEPLPAPAPGEPPGTNLNLEWWQYIGLSERHSLATAIKPYIEDRVSHWRFIYSPTAPSDSDNTPDEARGDLPQQPEHPESGAVRPRASIAARAPSSSGASAMDSPTRIKFETGLALAEVTLDQDLKDQGPSLEIARKYVISATLTLARCILTPNCEEPYEAIRRAYDFAEWFAAETMKTAWVWLSVFSEMNTSGKLEKYNREGRTEDGAPKGMTESELREWHGCLSGVAQEALDEFVPEFWKERLKYFSDVATDAPKPAEAPRIGLDTTSPPLQGDGPTPPQRVTDGEPSDRALAAKKARACTVARIIRELDQLRPQMFEDQKEYDSLRMQYPDFLAFLIADRRPDLKTKILAIRASTRHIRLAQEIAAAHHGRQLSTIQDDWKDFKPEEFKRSR